MIPTGFMKH